MTPSRNPRSRTVATALLGASIAGGLALLSACGADPGVPTRVVAGAPTDTAPPADLPGGIPADELVDETGKAEITVTVIDNNYEPRAVKVSPGTKVTFDNVGANPHNVIPSGEPAFPAIPTGELDSGMKGSVDFGTPGTFAYHCSIHGTAKKGQRGVVVVG